MTRYFFDGMICMPNKLAKKNTRILDPGFYRICRILGIFLEILVWWKTKLNRTWKGDINLISFNMNKLCISLILARIRNQRKRWLGSWHMSGHRSQFFFIFWVPASSQALTFMRWHLYGTAPQSPGFSNPALKVNALKASRCTLWCLSPSDVTRVTNSNKVNLFRCWELAAHDITKGQASDSVG